MKQDINTIAPLSPRELKQQTFGNEGEVEITPFYQLFHISRLEDVVQTIKFPLPPQRKTVFDFLFLTRGHSARSKGLHRFEFSKNTFFFLPALQISIHECISPDTEGYFCHFDGEIFNQLSLQTPFHEAFSFWHFTGDPLVSIPDQLVGPVLNILDRLLYHYQTHLVFPTHLIASYLLALFNELGQVKKGETTSSLTAALRITRQFKHLLSQHIYTYNKVAAYASMLSITPDHLNKCVKVSTGKTAQELLGDMVILEAKVLLRQTPLSISEIAFRFSETNTSDFSRFFKSRTGLTPKEYRKQTSTGQ